MLENGHKVRDAGRLERKWYGVRVNGDGTVTAQKRKPHCIWLIFIKCVQLKVKKTSSSFIGIKATKLFLYKQNVNGMCLLKNNNKKTNKCYLFAQKQNKIPI